MPRRRKAADKAIAWEILVKAAFEPGTAAPLALGIKQTDTGKRTYEEFKPGRHLGPNGSRLGPFLDSETLLDRKTVDRGAAWAAPHGTEDATWTAWDKSLRLHPPDAHNYGDAIPFLIRRRRESTTHCAI